MAKSTKAKTYFEDGISLRAIEPGKLYSARIRMEPDAHLGGEHEKWYWSKSRQIGASSKARALVEAERYRKELIEGDGGVNLTVAALARQWQDERKLQAEATLRSTGIAKPSLRTIERDEAEIKRIESLFPSVTVRNFTPSHIEKVVMQMRKDGVSEQTIFKMFKKLKQILKRPAITGHIDFNPCLLVTTVHEPPVNPATKAFRRIDEDTATEFIAWLFEQKLNGRIVALWLGMTEHIRLGEALALRACDLDFDNDAIYIRGTLDKRGEIVPAKAGSERALAMDSFVKAALNDKAPEERSLEAFREAITTMEPDEWPDWVRELSGLVSGKCVGA